MTDEQEKDQNPQEATKDDLTEEELKVELEPSEEPEAEPVESTVDWEAMAASRYDQLLRLQADFENFRRRADRERAEAEVQIVGRILSDLLPVYDNLERAVRFMPTDGDAKAWRVGIEMTLKGFNEALTRVGVEAIPTVGEIFDPRVHEAVQQVESDFDEGVVAEELQKGFRWRERVLRAAMVKVSVGRPEPAEDRESSGSTDFQA